MNTVEPIRSIEQIELFKSMLTKNKRNLILFVLGINSGLRVSDLLHLKISDVANKNYIELIEQKTHKFKRIPLTNKLYNLINTYICEKKENYWLFQSQKGTKPITRVQAYRILNSVSKKVGIEEKIGTHSLRKTFGYHLYKKTKDIALLQMVLNHSSPKITLRYLGINQEIIDSQLKEFCL